MNDTYRTPAADPRGNVVNMTLSAKSNKVIENASQLPAGGASLSFGL